METSFCMPRDNIDSYGFGDSSCFAEQVN
uniref:Uncharacterized protein n=1 Tax=Arundo donax TaxID=35708 RepID=A0A0A9HV84_ARUDO